MRRGASAGRPTRREDLAAWYGSLLERQAASGLSVTEFAATAGVSAWTLYDWRRRLGDTATARETAPRLVEVSVVPASQPTGSGIGIELRSGHRLDVRSGFRDDDLRRLIRVLESC
jgi:hypothetical protein